MPRAIHSGKRIALLASVLLVLTAIAVAILVWIGRPEPAHPPAEEPQVQAAKPGAPAPSAIPPAAKTPVKEADAPPPAAAPEIAIDQGGQLLVRCVDTSGKPVPDVQLGWRTSQTAPRMRRSSDPSGNARTDAAGEFTVRGAADHEAHIEVTDEAWYARPAQALLAGTEPLLITVRPAVTIRFRAQYDDGQPVLYMGEFQDIARGGYSGSGFSLQDEGRATIKRVPVDKPLLCIVFAQQRPGYDKHREELSVAQLTSGNEILVVVTKSARAGGIRVEFLNGKFSRDTTVFLEAETGPAQMKNPVGTADFFAWGGLLAGTRYRLSMHGARAWRSDWIEVKGGEETLVRASLEQGGGVKARLLDERGRPIKGGIVRVANGKYARFMAGGQPWFFEHSSQEDGVATLAGLPPTALPLEFEAWGREIVSREVNVVGDVVTDLGDIVLSPGAGSVTVELTGMKDGLKYYAGPVEPFPFGSFVGPKTVAVDGKCALTGLPLRKYRIGVMLGDYGGNVMSEIFELTEANSAHVVRLDVSTLEPARIIRGEHK